MGVLQQIINHEILFNHYSLAIIPTVLIPLTGMAVILSSVATIIASWFGIKLKSEGPKQLLEVLLTKKVLISALLINLLFLGLSKAYTYTKNSSLPLVYINYQSKNYAKSSEKNFEESLTRPHSYEVKNSLSSSIVSLTEKWVIKIPKGAFRSITPSAGSLFLGSDDGLVYDLDSQTGSINRTFYVGTQVTTRPLIYNNRLYVGEGEHLTHHARIYAFNLKDGQIINSFQTKGHTEGQAVIAKNNNETSLFIVAGKDGLYSVNPETMKLNWHAIDGHLDATVSVEGDKVYSGSGKEKGVSFDRSYATVYDFASGRVIWKKELPLSNWMHPLLTNHLVCYTLGEIYTESEVGIFHCFDKINGKPLLSIPFNSPLVGKPLYLKYPKKEMAFVSSFNGEVCAVNITSQSTSWCLNAGTPKTSYALSSVSYDSKRHLLWYASYDNGLFALSPETGEIKYHWMPNKDSLTPWKSTMASATILDDSLYLVDLKGYVRKLDINL